MALKERARRAQERCEYEFGEHARFWEGSAATVALVVVVALMVTHRGPFATDVPRDTSKDGVSLWGYLLSDGTTLGAVHLMVIALSVFAVVSAAGLFASGRWLRGFGKDGAAVDDDRRQAVTAIDDLTEQVRSKDEIIDAVEWRIAEAEDAMARLQVLLEGSAELTGRPSRPRRVDGKVETE